MLYINIYQIYKRQHVWSMCSYHYNSIIRNRLMRRVAGWIYIATDLWNDLWNVNIVKQQCVTHTVAHWPVPFFGHTSTVHSYVMVPLFGNMKAYISAYATSSVFVPYVTGVFATVKFPISVGSRLPHFLERQSVINNNYLRDVYGILLYTRTNAINHLYRVLYFLRQNETFTGIY